MANTQQKLQQLEKTAQQMGKDISELLGEGKQEGQDRLHQVAETAKEKWGDLKEKGKEVNQIAHEHMWMTAVITAITGAVIGVILGAILNRK